MSSARCSLSMVLGIAGKERAGVGFEAVVEGPIQFAVAGGEWMGPPPTLTGRATSLTAGALQAVAAGETASRTALELELISILEGPAFRTSPRSRAFMRFWTAALAHHDRIMVEVDPQDGGQAISPAMAEAAPPFYLVGSSFQTPVHLGVAGNSRDPRFLLILLSTAPAPPGSSWHWAVGNVEVYYMKDRGPTLWMTGRSPEDLGRAVRILSDRSSFP